jgi:DNA-binding IclR family transcriptional regulator
MATPLNQSVFKAFAMLRSFRDPNEWLTSSELSRRAKLPEASGYRMIQTLEEIGAVVRGPRGRYRPGMLLVSLSQNVIVPELLSEIAQPVADQLSQRLNVTVHMGMLERGMVTYVVKSCTTMSFHTETRAGAQLEAYCSGLGKVLLADLPREQLDAIICDGALVPLTPSTITSLADLRAHLDKVRVQGFALDEGEFRPDIFCVAVPIRDDQGRTVAAISATEDVEAMTPERRNQLRGELAVAAAVISSKAFPSGPSLVSDMGARAAPIIARGRAGLIAAA